MSEAPTQPDAPVAAAEGEKKPQGPPKEKKPQPKKINQKELQKLQKEQAAKAKELARSLKKDAEGRLRSCQEGLKETAISDRWTGGGRQQICDLLVIDEATLPKENVRVCGWVKTARTSSAELMFCEVNDGTTTANLQVVCDTDTPADAFAAFKEKVATNVSVALVGTLIKSPKDGQPVELKVTGAEVVGTVGPTYPFTKAKTTLEHLREHPHLRVRTNVFGSVMRIRHVLGASLVSFFDDRGFKQVHTPLITSNDCEGAGEAFIVDKMLSSEVKDKKTGKRFTKEEHFFDIPRSLTVSGQLHVEAFSAGLTNVYTFGPTFRAENSNTARHLAEFWMCEPELYFATMKDACDVAEDFVRTTVRAVIERCSAELLFLDDYHNSNTESGEKKLEDLEADAKEGGLIQRLANVVSKPFEYIKYTDAVALFEKEGMPEELKMEWGDDLSRAHEKYLTDEVFKCPVFVTHWPRKIKSFYMKWDESNDQVVEAFDLLVPGIGELIGGSAREHNLEKLEKEMAEKGVPKDGLEWFLDLRRHATAPHCGWGIGFERLVMLATGMANIRDTIPYPRWAHHCVM